jgi:peroxiredoxin family protein
VQARFDSTHNFGASAFKLPTWTGSFTRPMPELEGELGRHWDKTINPFLDSLRFDWQKAAVLPGLAAALIVFLCLVGKAWAAAGVITVIAAAGIGIYVWQRFEAMETLRRQAETTLRTAKKESLSQLRHAGAELTDWTTRFQAADAKDTDVRQMFDLLRLAQNPSTPFDQRSFTYVQGGTR